MIREPCEADQGYIAATWARSMLSTHAHQRHMRSRTGEQIGQQINTVLDRPDTRALLSVEPALPDRIRGWILYCVGPATPVVHYIYVRKDNRGGGIATALLDRIGVRHAAGVVCTSLGPSSQSLRSRYKAAVYIPLDEFLK